MSPATSMQDVLNFSLAPDEAGLWFLGQSGFILRAGSVTVVIDPYLSDSVSKSVPELTRLYPPPIKPEELQVDVFLVTHDHLDHLDPETIAPYPYKQQTMFVAPRLAARKLFALGVPEHNLAVIDSGIMRTVRGIEIAGVYALPNEPAVIDAAGYHLTFVNGRSVYHSSDTGFSEVLLAAVPQAEVALLCINGKCGNMDAAQAARIAAQVQAKIALPHHYDMFALNAENPRALGYQLKSLNPAIQTPILEIMTPLVWSG
jgi:L-ascorbate 6-phosphate lactonase